MFVICGSGSETEEKMTLCAQIAAVDSGIGNRARKERRRYPFFSTPTSFVPSTLLPAHVFFFHTPSTKKKLYISIEAETAEQLLERASSSGSAAKEPRIDGRAFRRSLTKTGRYVRNPANDADSLALMEEHGVGYSSTGLVAQMRKPENSNTWKQGNLTVTLAQAYGKRKNSFVFGVFSFFVFSQCVVFTLQGR